MSKDYIPSNDAEFLQQLIGFNANIGTYTTALLVTGDQMESQNADMNYFSYLTSSLEIMRNAGIEWTAWRNIVRDGGSGAGTEAEVPVLPPGPPSVPPGIESRFRALCNQIKASPGYNEAIGKALGIVAESTATLDLLTVKPSLSIARDGNDVFIRWGWGRNRGPLEMCEIHVDRGDGKGFLPLAFDTTPNYIDTHELPLTPTVWTYKAIYHAKDRQVGQWSDPVSLSVGG